MSDIAKRELGFSGNESAPVTARSRRTGSNKSMSAAATERWAGWHKYKSQHPNATSTDYWKARKAGK